MLSGLFTPRLRRSRGFGFCLIGGFVRRHARAYAASALMLAAIAAQCGAEVTAVEQLSRHGDDLPRVVARLSGRVHHLEPLLRGVGAHLVAVDPGEQHGGNREQGDAEEAPVDGGIVPVEPDHGGGQLAAPGIGVGGVVFGPLHVDRRPPGEVTDPTRMVEVEVADAHADHVGGLVRDGALAFPNAAIRMSADEWTALQADAAMADLVRVIAPKVETFAAEHTTLTTMEHAANKRLPLLAEHQGTGGQRVLRWQYISSASYPLIPPDEAESAIYYGYAEVRSDRARSVWLGLGADDDGRWHAEDWYLDLVDVPGTPPLLLDTDELLAAHREGLLDTAQCVEAVEIATRALVGAAEHGNDIQDWLDAAAGGAVAFRDHDHRRHGEAR